MEFRPVSSPQGPAVQAAAARTARLDAQEDRVQRKATFAESAETQERPGALEPEPESEPRDCDAPPPGADWFSSLFGFSEAESVTIKYGLTKPAVAPHSNVQRHIELLAGNGSESSGNKLRSRINGMEYGVGCFTCPSLCELQADAAVARALSDNKGSPALTVQLQTGVDVAALHGCESNAGAVFQVASQFNCLEFPGPRTTPEDGVTNYAHDRTQGPACAVAAGPATVYRNYFVQGHGLPKGQRGQTAAGMIDNFAALGEALGNRDGSLLDLRGGYTTSHSDASLRELGQQINAANSPAKRDALRKLLRVGLHTDVEVTATEWGKKPVGRATFEEQPDGHSVTQVLCSACSLDYGKSSGLFSLKMPLARERAVLWEPLARLVLEAAYEATILAALRQGAKVVFLTLLGGGVFKNDVGWIVDAIARALDLVRHCSLQVQIVCYEARAHPLVKKLVEKVQSGVIPLAPVRLLD